MDNASSYKDSKQSCRIPQQQNNANLIKVQKMSSFDTNASPENNGRQRNINLRIRPESGKHRDSGATNGFNPLGIVQARFGANKAAKPVVVEHQGAALVTPKRSSIDDFSPPRSLTPQP